MSTLEHVVYAAAVVLICLISVLVVRLCCRPRFAKRMRTKRIRRRLRDQNIFSNQQEDIYNISSRVQGQGQWPTHDGHVSLDNFTITNEINKYNDDPPTYEEAMNFAASNNNNNVVPAVVPKTTTSTSTSTAN